MLTIHFSLGVQAKKALLEIRVSTSLARLLGLVISL